MHISLEWTNDFLDPKLTTEADEIAHRFMLSTAEIDSLTKINQHLTKITAAEITAINPHPDADKLRLADVLIAQDKQVTVVCGAPNIRAGMKVPYAPLGTHFPNGMILEEKKIRGVVSNGMLCSANELGLGEDHSGILELDNLAPLGAPLSELLGLSTSTVIEIDNKAITNRPDLWGHYGVARELSAIFELELKDRFNKTWQDSIRAKFATSPSPIKVRVVEGSAASVYHGLSIDGIKIGPSPTWMQERLSAVGLRPINNIVDIGNYVMLELAQPLHMFDREKIQGNEIVIRTVESDSELALLDGTTISLIAGDTVVADSHKPLVLAGIMGGIDSGVADTTTKIFIEAANWNAVSIRKTSTRCGIRTDSSQRFEKGLDSSQAELAILRAAELVLELCPGAKIVGQLESEGPWLSEKRPAKVIRTSADKVSALLGITIPESDCKAILSKLGFVVEQVKPAIDGRNLAVTVPSFRGVRDFEWEADLIEEIGRIYGYNRIQPSSPTSGIKTVQLSGAKQLHRATLDYFIKAARCHQIESYALLGEKLLEECNWPDSNEDLKLINPISIDRDRMRPSIAPLLLESIALNSKSFESFSIVELGKVYAPAKDFSHEWYQLGVAFFDRSDNRFVELAEHVESYLTSVADNFKIRKVTEIRNSPPIVPTWSGAHPNEYLGFEYRGRAIGAMTTIHPLLMKSLRIKGNAVVALIDLETLEDKWSPPKRSYVPFNRFPTSSLDCTVTASLTTYVEEILTAVLKAKLKNLTDCKIVDVYTPSPQGAEGATPQKAVTLRARFQKEDGTLSTEELKKAEQALIETLTKSGFPLKS